EAGGVEPDDAGRRAQLDVDIYRAREIVQVRIESQIERIARGPDVIAQAQARRFLVRRRRCRDCRDQKEEQCRFHFYIVSKYLWSLLIAGYARDQGGMYLSPRKRHAG